jgi:tRNA(fMet)-specific endonuclease VapC
VAVRQILLDTNAYAAFKRNLPEAVELIRRAPLVGINTIVLGELLAGFAVGTRESPNKQELNILVNK